MLHFVRRKLFLMKILVLWNKFWSSKHFELQQALQSCGILPQIQPLYFIQIIICISKVKELNALFSKALKIPCSFTWVSWEYEEFHLNLTLMTSGCDILLSTKIFNAAPVSFRTKITVFFNGGGRVWNRWRQAWAGQTNRDIIDGLGSSTLVIRPRAIQPRHT